MQIRSGMTNCALYKSNDSYRKQFSKKSEITVIKAYISYYVGNSFKSTISALINQSAKTIKLQRISRHQRQPKWCFTFARTIHRLIKLFIFTKLSHSQNCNSTIQISCRIQHLNNNTTICSVIDNATEKSKMFELYAWHESCTDNFDLRRWKNTSSGSHKVDNKNNMNPLN